MESHLNNERWGLPHPDMRPDRGGWPEGEWKDLQDALREFRDSVHAAARRPDTFWENQRSAISAKLQQPARAPRRGPAWLWMPVAAAVLLCLFLFVEQGKAPIPDFAAGSDQELLTDIEHWLDRQYPDALEPVALITEEMRQEKQTSDP